MLIEAGIYPVFGDSVVEDATIPKFYVRLREYFSVTVSGNLQVQLLFGQNLLFPCSIPVGEDQGVPPDEGGGTPF